MVRWGVRDQHPQPAARDCAQMPAGVPPMQTPRPWSVRNPPGQEQLLLNRGQEQPRGQAGFGGSLGLRWGQGLEGALAQASRPRGAGLVWGSLFWKLG